MSARKPPILREGGLTGRVYIVTAYTERFSDDGDYLGETATTKFDVTDQFEAILAARMTDSPTGTSEQYRSGGTAPREDKNDEGH